MIRSLGYRFSRLISNSLRMLYKNDIRILCYHSVGNQNTRLSVSPELFDKHMCYLKQNFTPISLKDLPNYLTKKTISTKPPIAVTFDDGYLDNYENAFSILTKHKIPATIFVISGKIGKTNLLDELPIALATWEQINTMLASGLITIGAHSHSHPKFWKLSEEELRQEIMQSKTILEENLSREIIWFSYPKSQYSSKGISIIQECGFDYAMGMTGFVSSKSYRFLIPRILICDAPTEREFQHLTNYDPDWIRYRLSTWTNRKSIGPRL